MSQITNNSIILTNSEFKNIKQIIYTKCGINITIEQKNLLEHKLRKRLKHCTLDCFTQYYNRLNSDPKELQEMINVVTTNETYFFREQRHFDFLNDVIINEFKDKKLKIWSAASSVGAEAYSIAMVLEDAKIDYTIIGSDINTEVIKKATVGLYPIKWMDKIPENLKVKYCLKGKGSHEGWFLVDRCLIEHIHFEQKNLMEDQSNLGQFNIIFLRNVLIYFNEENKDKIIKNVLKNLKIGGYLIISLTEYIQDLESYNIKKIQSSIFQKV